MFFLFLSSCNKLKIPDAVYVSIFALHLHACVLDISIFETLSHVFIFTHRTSTSFRYLIVIDFISYDCFVYFSVHIHIFFPFACVPADTLSCVFIQALY